MMLIQRQVVAGMMVVHLQTPYIQCSCCTHYIRRMSYQLHHHDDRTRSGHGGENLLRIL